MKKIFCHLLVFSFLLVSCDSEERLTTEKEIKFSFSHEIQENSTGSKTNSQLVPFYVLVTIKNAQGSIVAERKELTLYKFGITFLSSPLTLKTQQGESYQLTEFFVLNENHEVIYVTPIEDSALAHLVSDPLEIEFAITKDQITTVTPEVLAVDSNTNPSQYGYGQFGFSIVKTINTVFSSFIKGPDNFELTESHIKIEGLADSTGTNTTILWSYEKELEARANQIVLRQANGYRITATKPGYNAWILVTTAKNNQAFEIIFNETQDNGRVWNVSFNQLGLDLCQDAVATRDGGTAIVSLSKYSSGNNVARLNNNGEVLWRKRFTDYERMGNGLYTILQSGIDDGFFLGGNNSCHLINPEDCEYSQSVGWLTKVDGSGNFLWSREIPRTISVLKITPSHTPGNIIVWGSHQGNQASGISPKHILTELNNNGEIIWQRSSHWSFSYRYKFNRVDDGSIVSQVYEQSEYVNATIIKHNAIGQIQWVNNTLPGNWFAGDLTVLEKPEGYLIMTTQRNVPNPNFTDCTTNLPHGATDLVMAMLSKDGALQWVKTITREAHELLVDSKLLHNGNVIAAGIVHTDCRNNPNYLPRWFFMELTSEGDVVSETVLTGSLVDEASGKAPEMNMTKLCHVRDNEYIVVGSTNILDGDTPDHHDYYRFALDIWAMKIRF